MQIKQMCIILQRYFLNSIHYLTC
uniref:Uncharacterized protein n=1 Tax=Anguilla anguilla TaxID=7936 RepID=A0A0E9U997_ANGAN